MFRLEVIDYFDSANQSVVARVPESGSAAIQFGAQLIVQQNQQAVFFRDGRAMDSFGPGRHTLTTSNLPLIGKILTAPFERSPFQAQVYFVGLQTFVDQRWGTRQPILLRDRDFGVVRLRGFGKFSYRVIDAALLINTLVGTQGKLTTTEIVDFLRDNIVTGISEVLATANVALLDMPAKLGQLSAVARVKLGDQFSQLGLELTQLTINSISPPEEVQKAIDARSGMAVVGDLRSYTVYQTANGIAAAGQNPGGAGGSGVGMGLGFALPAILQQAFASASGSIGNVFGAPSQPVAGLPAPNQPALPPPSPTSIPSAIDLSQFKPAAVPPTSNATPQELLQKIATQSGYEVQQLGDEFVLTVSISSLRRQMVHVKFSDKDQDGYPVTKVWSGCGVVSPSNAMMLLRSNNKLMYGAFAIQSLDGGAEMLVIQANMLSETIDALELSKCISAIAFQADQVEEQLSGGDDKM